jgi:hypothetical protein
MSDFNLLIESDWFELGTLVLQAATLGTVVWFGREALGILAGRQRRISMTQIRRQEPSQRFEAPAIRRGEAPAPESIEMEAEPESAHVFGGSPRGLIPMDAPAGMPAPRAEYVAPKAASDSNMWSSIAKWLNAPMSSDATVPWRRIKQIV